MKITQEIRLRVKFPSTVELTSNQIAIDQRTLELLDIGPEDLVEICEAKSLIVSVDREKAKQVPLGCVLIPISLLVRHINLTEGDEITLRKFESRELRLRVFPLKERIRSFSHVVLNKIDFTSLSLERLSPIELIGANSITALAEDALMDDPDPGTILMDNETRRRLGIHLNDSIKVRKTLLLEANYVEITLERGYIWHRPSLESWVRERIRFHQIIAAGDKIFLPFDRAFGLENQEGITLLIKRTVPDKYCKMNFRTQIKIVGEETDQVPYDPAYPRQMTAMLACERILHDLLLPGKAVNITLVKGESNDDARGHEEYPDNPLQQLSENVKSWFEKLKENGTSVKVH